MGNILSLAAILISLQLANEVATTLYNERTLDMTLDQLVETFFIEYEEQLKNGKVDVNEDPQTKFMELLTEREQALKNRIKRNERKKTYQELKQKFTFTNTGKSKIIEKIRRIEDEQKRDQAALNYTTQYKETFQNIEMTPNTPERPEQLNEPKKTEEPKEQQKIWKLKPKIGKRYLIQKTNEKKPQYGGFFL